MASARPTASRRRSPRSLLVGTVALAVIAGLVAAPAYAARTATADGQQTGPRVAPTVAAGTVRPEARTGGGCGNQTMKRKGDGTAWTCAFGDEFNGTDLDPSKWQVQQTATSGFRNGPECYVDSTRNVAVRDGALRLTAREDATPQTCTDPVGGDFSTPYTGAMVTTWDRFSQAYGRWQVRARFPKAKQQGLHSALWLWPQDQDAETYGQWPASGEIDVAEFYTKYPDRAIPYLHYARSKKTAGTEVTNNYCYVKRPDAFHVYELTWTPSRMTIKFDGKVCLQTGWAPDNPLSTPAPFDRPYVLNLTQALGLTGSTNDFKPGGTPLPATTAIDWVRVWK